MAALNLENYRQEVERALWQVLRLAFLRRQSTVADRTALAALDVGRYKDRDLVYVSGETRVYELGIMSGAAGGPDVVVPGALPTAWPRARWLRCTSSATYGPNWKDPLHGRGAGPLRAVELYTGDGGPDEAHSRCLLATPALLLDEDGDRMEPLSVGYPGSLYRSELTFALMLYTKDLRSAPSSALGSGVSEPDNTGWQYLVGQLRMVLAGMNSDQLGIEIDRVEVGDCALVAEDAGERVMVHALEVMVRSVVTNPDKDLDPLAVDAQPELVRIQAPFDRANYVARGYHIAPGLGLAVAWPADGVATVGGVAISSSPPGATLDAQRDTYCDLGPDGVIYYSPANVGLDAPALTAGRLRLGYIRTDASNVVGWVPLCSYAEIYRSSYQVLP